MAGNITDIKVFNQYAYKTRTEVLDYNIALFNQKSGGAIVLKSETIQGDFADETFFKKAARVRRRDAYSQDAIATTSVIMDTETAVKVAAGTDELRFETDGYKRIQMNPEAAGIAFGEQLAEDTFADMLSVAVGAACAALAGQAANYLDVSGGSGGAEFLTYDNLALTQAKFGDQAGKLTNWLMHSSGKTKLLRTNLANAVSLFSFGTVAVNTDAEGRPLLVADLPSLIAPSTTFYTLGLQKGGVEIQVNDDFDDNMNRVNGTSQIYNSYQAQWSYNVKLLGMAWDKTAGASPNNAALFTSANWIKKATSAKDLPGALLRHK